MLPAIQSDPAERAVLNAEILLDRYGVVTRGVAAAEEAEGGYAAVYRILAAAEEAGRVRRGYFVETLGAAQFATGGAIDRLRSFATVPGDSPSGETARSAPALVLASTDPANPFGAAIPWPERPGSAGLLPGRKAGALVVLSDGELVLYVERGGRTLLSWESSPQRLRAAADALALAVRDGALGRLTVEKADGESILGSDNPVAAALSDAGFRMTPRGLRLRR